MPRPAKSPDSLRDEITAYIHTLENYYHCLGEPCLETNLLGRGVWFEGRRHSDDYEQTKVYRKKYRPKSKQCYFNSQMYCCADDSARYFEGFAIFQFAVVPADHAWVVMPDGCVVDFTFEALERKAKRLKLKCDTSDAVYFGLEIPRKFIARMVAIENETRPMLLPYFEEILRSGAEAS